jgi:hypothetical protein
MYYFYLQFGNGGILRNCDIASFMPAQAFQRKNGSCGRLLVKPAFVLGLNS